MRFLEAVAQVNLLLMVILFIEVRTFDFARWEGGTAKDVADSRWLPAYGLLLMLTLVVSEFVTLRGLLLGESPSPRTVSTIGTSLVLATFYALLPVTMPLVYKIGKGLPGRWSVVVTNGAYAVFGGTMLVLLVILTRWGWTA